MKGSWAKGKIVPKSEWIHFGVTFVRKVEGKSVHVVWGFLIKISHCSSVLVSPRNLHNWACVKQFPPDIHFISFPISLVADFLFIFFLSNSYSLDHHSYVVSQIFIAPLWMPLLGMRCCFHCSPWAEHSGVNFCIGKIMGVHTAQHFYLLEDEPEAQEDKVKLPSLPLWP